MGMDSQGRVNLATQAAGFLAAVSQCRQEPFQAMLVEGVGYGDGGAYLLIYDPTLG